MFICLLKNNKFYRDCQKLSEKLRYLYYMLKVDVKKDGIEKALKTLKSKVIKTKQNQMLFGKKEFVKKSVERRQQKLKASYVQKMKSKLD
jgi:small subunit ribosomal protein S21